MQTPSAKAITMQFYIMTFVLLIPYIFLLGIFYFTLYVAMSSGSAGFAIIAPLCLVAILLLYGLYCAFVYRWMIDFSYGNSRIVLKVSIPVTMLFMFIQIVLCILTAGLFVPIAVVMIYRYIVGNMRLVSEAGEESAFGYQGRIGYDCLYVYGQALLTVITAGIYTPWLISKVGRRLVSTFVTFKQCHLFSFLPIFLYYSLRGSTYLAASAKRP